MMTESIIVAVIGAVGIVLASLVQSLRRENRRDHATVSNSLNRIETKLDGHIDNHAAGVYSPVPTTGKDTQSGSKPRPKRPRVDRDVSPKSRRPRG